MLKDASCRYRERTRRQYALDRLRVATNRLMRADSDLERVLASHWVNAWASAIGDIRFSALVESRLGYKPKRRHLKFRATAF
jgi:hypothetical protein